MDNKQRFGGMFSGSYAGVDPSNVPVTSPGSLSPYMGIDPSIIASTESQYIFPEGSDHKRGRLQLSFSQIGGSVMAGAMAGGSRGLYSGLMETRDKDMGHSVRRSALANYIGKQGGSGAQALGTIALLYSITGIALHWGRGVEDELNTLAAAGITGMLFKSSGGRAGVLRGGAVGLGLASVYCLLTSKDRVKQMLGMQS